MSDFSIFEYNKSSKAKMRFFGPNSLDSEGNVMPFSAL